MANIEDVYKRLNELHAEILRITITGVLDQATEAKQDELISVVSKEAKQDAHTVIFNSINDVLDQMELNQDQQSSILNAINASIATTNLKLDDVNTELDNISATDFATSTKQDTQIANEQDIISKLASLDAKTYGINPKIEESPQELLRLIHGGIDTLIQQQMLTNNLLKLILS